MAESLISIVLDQLASITRQQAAQAFKLVPGVEEEVENLTSNLKSIQAVLEDAEEREVTEKVVKNWLDKLRDVLYDIEDVLDEWKTALLKRKIEQEGTRVIDVSFLKKVRSSILPSCFGFRQIVLRCGIAVKIKEQNKKLAAVAYEKSRFKFKTERKSHEQIRNITTSVIDESEVFGREEDKKTIKDMLLCESSEETAGIRIISVVGMVGIGKTTLARLAFNDPEVGSHFEKRIWVCVSDPFDEQIIALEILESLRDTKPDFESLGGTKPDLAGKDNIMREISEWVSGNKILLVLDDVWTGDSSHWEHLKASLKNSSAGSRILVTTRNERVGKAIGSESKDMFLLGKLSEDICWLLLCHLAFFDRTREECEHLEEIGRKIVERCNGLPLLVKTIGGLLRFKETRVEWQNMLDEMLEIREVKKCMSLPFLLSMPPVLRQCFSNCAIFPKDYKIEKDKLIKLWMAQGFLNDTKNIGMEVIGEEYFKALAMSSVFYDFKKDENDDIISCKMHDLGHEFAKHLPKKECLLIEIDGENKPWENTSFMSIRHLMLKFEREITFPMPMGRWKKLRSLLINSNVMGYSLSEEILLDSIDQLTCLRSLDLSGNRTFGVIRKLPDKIGRLINLRYLNLSRNKYLKVLPEPICDLYNLQTLDITECCSLIELPHGIGKLINLMYLENKNSTYSLSFMPQGMGRLTHMRTLKEFVVSSTGDKESFSLEGLAKLKHLQGHLKIRQLPVAEMGEARLSAMTGLRRLTLEFNLQERRQIIEYYEKRFLDALQPPPCLETLEISFLESGTFFPNWMMSLKLLKRVRLTNCTLSKLPPMGKLPALEYLDISCIDKVTKVGEEFLGIERENSRQTSFFSSSSPSVAFPHLKRLRFQFMEEWEQWEELEYGDLSTSRVGEDSSGIKIMPELNFLSISNCLKLRALPHHLLQNSATIQELNVCDCPILEERFRKESRKDWPYLFHIPKIIVNDIDVQRDGH